MIGGIAAAAGADNIQAMVNASILETDNNANNLPPAVRQALGGAVGVAASIGTLGEVVKPEFWQAVNVLRQSDDPMALIKLGIEQTVAERQGDYAMYERLSDEFGKGMVAGRSAADVAMLADAIASLPLLAAKLVRAGGSVVVNGVKYTQVAGKIVREKTWEIAAETKNVTTVIEPKIAQQMSGRGWTTEAIDSVIANPTKKVVTRDTRFDPVSGGRLNEPATGYVAQDGSYVVKNDRTGQIVQISNKNDPTWKAPWDK